MGELTILKRLRILIGDIGWKLFIWGMDTSEENYWQMIYEQEKFRTEKHEEEE